MTGRSTICATKIFKRAVFSYRNFFSYRDVFPSKAVVRFEELRINNYLMFFLFFLAMSGCGNPLGPGANGNSTIDTDFHPGVPGVPSVIAELPRGGLKVTAGRVLSAGHSLSANLSAPSVNVKVKGARLSGSLSITN